MYRYITASRDELEQEGDAGVMRRPAFQDRPAEEQSKKELPGLICYFMLGAGLLGPWNAFITATDYFNLAFGHDSHMGRMFTICYLPLCAILIGVMVHYGPAVLNPIGRISFAFVGFTIIMMLVPVLDATLVDPYPQLAMGLILTATLMLGILDGLSQSAMFGEVAVMPPRFTHAVIGGTASSGLLLCLLRIITKAALPSTEDGLRTSAAVYFSIAALLSLCCLLTHLYLLPRLAVVRFYRQKAEHGNLLSHPSGGDVMLLPLSVPSSTNSLPRQAASPSPSNQAFTLGDEEDESEPITKNQLFSDADGRQHKERVKQCLHRIWPLAFTLFITYLVTLSIFPGVLAEDLHSETLGDWYGIILITVYNASDLSGKVLPLRLAGALRRSQHVLFTLSILRVLFWPAFVVAVAMEAPTFVMALLTTLLGLTNGFITSLAMTMGQIQIPAQDAELAENILVLFLVAGLNAGAFAGWIWLLPWPQWLGIGPP